MIIDSNYTNTFEISYCQRYLFGMKTYEYYDAIGPDGSKKPGINRITYVNGLEITREYFPVDPRTQQSEAIKAILECSPEDLEQIKNILGINK